MSVSRWMRESAINRRTFFAGAGAMSASLVAAACGAPNEVVVTSTVTPGQTTASGVTVPGPTSAEASTAQTSKASNVRIIASPKFGTADIAPTADITITTFNAKITDLVVTGSDGSTVQGELDKSGATWTKSDRLTFGVTYTFEGSATDNAGTVTPITGEMKTVNPASALVGHLRDRRGGHLRCRPADRHRVQRAGGAIGPRRRRRCP